MDFLGDLLGGIGELFVLGSFGGGGNGKNNDNGGCAIIFFIVALIGGVGMGISSCQQKTEVPPAPIVQKQQEVKKKETISHWVGRKTKDSAVEFGKGVIGK